MPAALIEQLHEAQRSRGEEETEFAAEEIWEIGDDSVPDGPTERWTMAEAINAALHQAMERDDSVVVLGEDVGLAGGVFRITEGLQEKFGEDRVIDTPLNESGIVGTAIGMAVAGARPVPEIQFDGFVYPAFDQIVSHLGRTRYRTGATCRSRWWSASPMAPGSAPTNTIATAPRPTSSTPPGWWWCVPPRRSTPRGCSPPPWRANDPVIFLEPKVLYRAGREDVPTEHYTFPSGEPGSAEPVTRDSWSPTAGWSPSRSRPPTRWRPTASRSRSSTSGRCSHGMPTRSSPRSNGPGGWWSSKSRNVPPGSGAEVAATVAERAGYALEAPVVRVAGFDAPWPQFAIEKTALIDSTQVAAALRRVMES